MVGHSAASRAAAWLGIFLVLSAVRVHAAGEWQLADAPLRYKLDLDRKPTHPSAGYYVHLPDGGILRGTSPSTVVMTEDGKVLPSFILWHNSESGFSIVFADPGTAARAVYVYTQSGRQPQLWRPESGITPSSILCTLPGRDSLPAAQALGKLGRVEPAVHSANPPGIPKAPFSIGGDQTGRPRPGSFYLLSYVEAATAGSYWFAPFIREGGQCEIHIDGTRINPKERSKVWGGTGASVELTQGLHRVEVFQTASGAGPYSSDQNSGGLMYLTWRPPGEELKQVESRVFKTTEIARSGACNLTAVQARDGTPVAAATARPGLCYWFENEEPLLIYDLSALTAGQPAGTTYTWSFPDGAAIEGAKVQWLFPGLRDSKLKLTVKSGASTSACTVSFFGFGTQPTSLENPAHREAYRKILASMLKAYPRSPDPVNDWSPAWWNNLLRTVESGEGHPLLLQLFTDHLDATRKKLAPGQLHTLQDVFLDLMQRQNPRETLQWLQKFQADATAVARQSELKLREGELLMYYLGDRKLAEKIFTALAPPPRRARRTRQNPPRRPRAARGRPQQSHQLLRRRPDPRPHPAQRRSRRRARCQSAPPRRTCPARRSRLAQLPARPPKLAENRGQPRSETRRASRSLPLRKRSHPHRRRLPPRSPPGRPRLGDRIPPEQNQRRLHPPRIRPLHQNGGLEARAAHARSLLP